jgi:hypothetical protein
LELGWGMGKETTIDGGRRTEDGITDPGLDLNNKNKK